MPKSRSKRRQYQPPPKPKPKPSAPWVGPTIAISLILGLAYILLYYLDVLPTPLAKLSGWNLLVGFAFLVFGLGLATRWV